MRSLTNSNELAVATSSFSIQRHHLSPPLINSFEPTNFFRYFFTPLLVASIRLFSNAERMRLPPSDGRFPVIIRGRLLMGSGDFRTTMFEPSTRYGLIPSTLLLIPSLYMLAPFCFPRPTTTQVTPALLDALFDQRKDVWAKPISTPRPKICGHNIATCSPWQMEFVATNPAFPSIF